MYSSARFMFSCLPASDAEAGSGTRPLIDSTSSGDVPQVTIGAISAAASVTSRSNVAPSSVGTVFQKAIALSQFSPLGANGLPFR